MSLLSHDSLESNEIGMRRKEKEQPKEREGETRKVGAVAAARHLHCITLMMLDLSPESALKMKDEQGGGGGKERKMQGNKANEMIDTLSRTYLAINARKK